MIILEVVLFTIPLTSGRAAKFTLHRRRMDGSPAFFAEDDEVDVVIDLEGGQACVPAALNGWRATVVIPSQVCDQARTGTRWRVIQASPDPNDPDSHVQLPLASGTFERRD